MGSEEKNSAIWSLLPSFDPSQDDIKEYVAKVKFVDGICPKKDRNMLAPRLAMLCKGTAWHQVRSIKADQLTNPDTGGEKPAGRIVIVGRERRAEHVRTF